MREQALKVGASSESGSKPWRRGQALNIKCGGELWRRSIEGFGGQEGRSGGGSKLWRGRFAGDTWCRRRQKAVVERLDSERKVARKGVQARFQARFQARTRREIDEDHVFWSRFSITFFLSQQFEGARMAAEDLSFLKAHCIREETRHPTTNTAYVSQYSDIRARWLKHVYRQLG